MDGPGSVVPAGVCMHPAGSAATPKIAAVLKPNGCISNAERRGGGSGFLQSLRVQAGARADLGVRGRPRPGMPGSILAPCVHELPTNLGCHKHPGPLSTMAYAKSFPALGICC